MGLASLLLSVIMPFGVVLVAVVGGIWVLVEWRVTKNLTWKILVAGTIPGGLFLLYQYWATVSDPFLAEWNRQNLTPSPPIWDLVIALSPALILAGWASWRMARGQAAGPQRLLITWVLVGMLLIYFPSPLQRRFMFAYYIAVALLAGWGLLRLEQWTARRKLLLGRALTGLSVVTNGFVLMIICFGVISLSPKLFLSTDEVNAFQFIRSALPENAVILCSPETGNFIPGWTGRRVIYGHPFETIGAGEQKLVVEQFFANTFPPESAVKVVEKNPDTFVFYGPREAVLGKSGNLSNFKPIFQNTTVTIYGR
jgi:hypothetical protein